MSEDEVKILTFVASTHLCACYQLTVNNMVESLRTFSTEVTRVAKEVGTEGKLGGRATVLGVGGTWKVSALEVSGNSERPDRDALLNLELLACRRIQDLTDSVNTMAANLTLQVRTIAHATVRAYRSLCVKQRR